MTKALVAFGSMTGNTEAVAGWIAETLGESGIDATVLDCASVSSPKDLCDGYDLIVFGSSTYGDDPIEIQEDFEPIYDGLGETGVSGKHVAVFGCGDSMYTHFCGAADAIAEKVGQCGGTLIADTLKIDDPHDDHEDDIRAWAKGVAETA